MWNKHFRSMYREEITSVTDATGRTGKTWIQSEQRAKSERCDQKHRVGGMERDRHFYRAIHHSTPSQKLF